MIVAGFLIAPDCAANGALRFYIFIVIFAFFFFEEGEEGGAQVETILIHSTAVTVALNYMRFVLFEIGRCADQRDRRYH